ncbi:16S rRNA (cytidine(1402)-2'-O)-methyltransferase [Priestia taiwanensis]|uniref:Ribosomal RNA small subunit methyltransferase I n=1 Tax=Priestia taiwanensis TaxID=1347902 RepID=A0A917ERW8_9BACI|nr:16S rRNA (cytidine(1402)-2'-O)-methyltransferase [Priestia taiwanensis]MBM7365194.1 16S rRNA (cytidine1402-2'-O)-methyltransferase [Priestia taiwanensis]GGE84517.1 ribosomal RNA small subunit methyltransferase I [Priestia taiwanensis]
MWQQKSFQQNEGILYLVPTPIGNLEDITFRALTILKEADLIAAEDTRQTKKLCNHFEISTPVTSYHEHNKEASGRKIMQALGEGKVVALVSDAGTPCISDPGYELVCEATAQRYTVVPLPGANAALCSLIASGLPTEHFYFYGFLQRQKKEKKNELERLKKFPHTIIFYESPHRLKETLQCMYDILGNRRISVSRELTKKFEEFIRGTVEEIIQWSQEDEIRGEFCIIVEGTHEYVEEEETTWWENISITDHVEHYVNEGMMSKDAIKTVAKERKMMKRDVYQEYHAK